MSDTCCAVMREAEEKFDLPFVHPLFVDPKTLDLGVATLSVQLDKLTASGNVSKKGRLTVYLNYCPFCGEKLREIEEAGREGENGQT